MRGTPWLVYAVIACRLLASTASSILYKSLTGTRRGRAEDAGAVTTASYLTMSLILACAAPFIDWHAAASGAFWGNMLVAGFFEAFGMFISFLALQLTDLSVFGPLNAFKAPLSMVVAALFFAEVPNSFGVAGTLVILGGSYLLAPPGASWYGRDVRRLLSSRGALLRFLGLAVFSSTAPFIKQGVLVGGTVPSVCALVWIGAATCAGVGVWNPAWGLRAALPLLMRRRQLFALLGPTLLAAQLSTNFTFGVMLVGYALALFQLGAVGQVMAGRVIFAEREFRRRLAATFLMIGGSLVIILLG